MPAPVAAPSLPRSLTVLSASAAGLAVANVYYAQPLLDAIAESFGISVAAVGLIGTITQVGYGLGLLLIVPLGDVLNRRWLILAQSLLSVGGLIVIAAAPTTAALLAGMAVVGLLAVVTQVLVAFVATFASPEERGRAVGTVTSGVVMGILLARTLAGSVAEFAGWRAVYVVSAGLTLLIAIALFRALPKRDNAVSMPYRTLVGSLLSLYARTPVLRVRATIAMLHFAAASVVWTSLVLPLSAEPRSLSPAAIGAFGLAGLAGVLGAARAGRLADRGLGQWATGAGLLLLLAAWLPIALIEYALWPLALGLAILDLQAVHVTNQSMILRASPEARSRLTAAYMLFYSIGIAAGSIASTSVYAATGWTGVCLLGASISAAALAFWAGKPARSGADAIAVRPRRLAIRAPRLQPELLLALRHLKAGVAERFELR